MKRFVISFLPLVFLAFAAMAQSPQEILDRMEEEMDKHDEKDGVKMTVDVKVPILGTMTTKVYSLGDKMRMEVKTMGVTMITWSDGVTEWTYTDKTNEVEIEKVKEGSGSGSEGDMEMFENITDGYDVSIKKETAAAWHIQCKKSKSNTDKDAPKSMEIVVEKTTYHPLSLTASISGAKMTMHDISFGITEEQVTFNIDDYPGAKITDKR